MHEDREAVHDQDRDGRGPNHQGLEYVTPAVILFYSWYGSKEIRTIRPRVTRSSSPSPRATACSCMASGRSG